MFKFGVAAGMHPSILSYLSFHPIVIQSVPFRVWTHLSQVINQVEILGLAQDTKLVMVDCALDNEEQSKAFKLWLLEAEYVTKVFAMNQFTFALGGKLPAQCSEKNKFIVGKLLNILVANHLKLIQDQGAPYDEVNQKLNDHMVFMRQNFALELQQEAFKVAVEWRGVKADLTMLPLM
jgi:hypothetical protein